MNGVYKHSVVFYLAKKKQNDFWLRDGGGHSICVNTCIWYCLKNVHVDCAFCIRKAYLETANLKIAKSMSRTLASSKSC